MDASPAALTPAEAGAAMARETDTIVRAGLDATLANVAACKASAEAYRTRGPNVIEGPWRRPVPDLATTLANISSIRRA